MTDAPYVVRSERPQVVVRKLEGQRILLMHEGLISSVVVEVSKLTGRLIKDSVAAERPASL